MNGMKEYLGSEILIEVNGASNADDNEWYAPANEIKPQRRFGLAVTVSMTCRHHDLVIQYFIQINSFQFQFFFN